MSYVGENFDMLSRLIKAVATQFGPNCETVLHDLTLPYDSTIVAIENGNITGRKVGDSGTNAGLEILRGTVNGDDCYNYVNQTKDGKILKSSSVYLKDAEGKVIGSICINFDITDFLAANKAINYFATLKTGSVIKEYLTGSIDEILDNMIQDALSGAGKPVEKMSREEKVLCVKALDDKGAFVVKKSADKIAKVLQISRFTLYNYLDEARGV
jgi:predicted transcriptional regulator YheO